jgi:hypothetical protein
VAYSCDIHIQSHHKILFSGSAGHRLCFAIQACSMQEGSLHALHSLGRECVQKHRAHRCVNGRSTVVVTDYTAVAAHCCLHSRSHAGAAVQALHSELARPPSLLRLCRHSQSVCALLWPVLVLCTTQLPAAGRLPARWHVSLFRDPQQQQQQQPPGGLMVCLLPAAFVSRASSRLTGTTCDLAACVDPCIMCTVQ